MKVRGETEKQEKREKDGRWAEDVGCVSDQGGGGGVRWDDEELGEMQRWRSEGRGSPSGRFSCPHM